MPTVRAVEQRIAAIEGFNVQFLTGSGVDVRGDRQIPARYPDYQRRANDTTTVEEWKRTRFRPAFAGFDVRVLNGVGEPVNGRTMLSTVRSTY
jgi:hypothetical protein